MAGGVNKVILVGNLGADPDMRHTPSGAGVCELRLATNESWTDKGGEKQERVEWHKIVVWGKLAEICSKYLSKGRQVSLEGRSRTRTWDVKEGAMATPASSAEARAHVARRMSAPNTDPDSPVTNTPTGPRPRGWPAQRTAREWASPTARPSTNRLGDTERADTPNATPPSSELGDTATHHQRTTSRSSYAPTTQNRIARRQRARDRRSARSRGVHRRAVARRRRPP